MKGIQNSVELSWRRFQFEGEKEKNWDGGEWCLDEGFGWRGGRRGGRGEKEREEREEGGRGGREKNVQGQIGGVHEGVFVGW